MDPKYLNSKSEFALGDHVQVSYMYNNELVRGTASYIEYALLNPGNTSGPYTDHIYISMEDPQTYRKWLLNGSSIIVKPGSQKCFIREIYYDDEYRIKQVKVAVDDGRFMSYPMEIVIGPEEIGSMLIWREGYNIKGTYGSLKIPPFIEIDSLPRPPSSTFKLKGRDLKGTVGSLK